MKGAVRPAAVFFYRRTGGRGGRGGMRYDHSVAEAVSGRGEVRCGAGAPGLPRVRRKMRRRDTPAQLSPNPKSSSA